MKLCVDCRNFIPVDNDPNHLSARCGAAYTRCLVTGKPSFEYAFNQRYFQEGKCGVDGILWLAKDVEVCNG